MEEGKELLSSNLNREVQTEKSGVISHNAVGRAGGGGWLADRCFLLIRTIVAILDPGVVVVNRLQRRCYITRAITAV